MNNEGYLNKTLVLLLKDYFFSLVHLGCYKCCCAPLHRNFVYSSNEKIHHKNTITEFKLRVRVNNLKAKKTSLNKSKAPLYISMALLGALVASYFFVPQVTSFMNETWNVLTSDDEDRIHLWISGFGWLGPVLLVLAMIAQMFLLVIPTILLMVVSVLAYGPIWGSVIIFASVFAASSVGYFIGNYFGDVIVTRIIGSKSQKKVAEFLDDYGFWAIIVTRINPFLSNDAISFVGGLLRMGYWKFIGATMAGIAPLTVFIAIMGKSTETLKTGLFWGSLGSLLVFIAYVWYDRSRSKS